jgi:hypothetical protein
VKNLLATAQDLPYGAERVALGEQAIRRADASGDTHAGYDARMELVETSTFGGYPAKALTAFSWCLAKVDENPYEFDLLELLWSYKWILTGMSCFPQVSRDQIKQMEDDLERRYREHGISLRGVHVKRMSNALALGDVHAAIQHHKKLLKSKRDLLSDCEACERSGEVRLLICSGDDQRALVKAEPILSGDLSCATIPHSTYGLILQPLVRLGREEEAIQYHRKGYRMVASNRKYLRTIAEHLIFAVYRGDLTKALRILEKQLPAAIETTDLHARFHFYDASTALFLSLAQRTSRARKVLLPTALDCYQASNKYDVQRLADWFDQELQQLTEQFNARNGNDYYSQLVAQTRQFVLGES